MSVIFSDPQPARFCPTCYAVPCRCSRLFMGTILNLRTADL